MRNVLLVDNDHLLLKVIAPRLEQEGHAVKTAENGLDALTVLKSFKPDVMFIDLVMPRIDGDNLCRIIRHMPEFDDSFLVIVSAAAAEMEFAFRDVGADACVAKESYGKIVANFLSILNNLDAMKREAESEKIMGMESVYTRQITRELIEEKRHLLEILNTVSEGVLETISGIVIYANQAAVSILGKTREETLSSFLPDFFAPQDRDRVEDLLETPEDQTAVIGPEAPLKIGKRLVSLKKPATQNAFAGQVLLLNDITALKHFEEQLASAETS